MTDLILEYRYKYSLTRLDPPRATARAKNVRETKTLFVVAGKQVEIIESSGPRFGAIEVRFYKSNGRSVGNTSTWQIQKVIPDEA